ncbi:hypothetical protein [Arthrobacter pascens]|uniref:hypothetical protein n=1 Tax=Arthrobacter pascens TaxID=1677 RepID=UPI0027DD82D6|nr:hypothetical protein [Arthrobacter pascens]
MCRVRLLGRGLERFGGLGGIVGCPPGVCSGCGQGLRRGGRGLGRFEGAAAAGREGLQGGCLLQDITVAGHEAAERRVQPAAAVQVPGQLADLLAALLLLFVRGAGSGGRGVGGVSPDPEFHQGIAVGVVRFQAPREGARLGGGCLRQEALDVGDLGRRRTFTGFGRGDVVGGGDLRRGGNRDGSREGASRVGASRPVGLCRAGEKPKKDGSCAEGGSLAAGTGQTHSQTSQRSGRDERVWRRHGSAPRDAQQH